MIEVIGTDAGGLAGLAPPSLALVRAAVQAGQHALDDATRPQLQVREAGFAPVATTSPMRLCIFLTDGYVGNDRGIVAAVRANAGTTRVFSFGIGNSVNRWLLDEMARAGRGESEFVTLEASADEAVERLIRRIQTPVLADVSVAFEGIEATAITPTLIPDLFDAKPIVVHEEARKRCLETYAATLKK